MKRRIFSMILAAALCMSCLPSAAFADEGVWDSGPAIGASGLCGHHAHDESCGEDGAACAFVCDVCAAEEQPADGVYETAGDAEPACACETDDPAIHSTRCPTYTAPENPECFCVERCAEDAPNVWCDVCGTQGAAACEDGADGAAAFAVDETFTEGDGLGYTITAEASGDTPGTVSLSSSGYVSGNVIIPAEVTNSITFHTYKVTAIENNAFLGNDRVTGVVIPEGVTEIGGSAFAGCTALASVSLPDGLTAIGDNAFENTPLTSIVIPDSVTSVGNAAFSATKLDSVALPENAGFTTIPNNMFWNCIMLQSIDIPDNVTSIGMNAFSGCDTLHTVTLPGKLTSIGSNAFSRCPRLTSLEIPPLTGGSSRASLTIGANAFATTSSEKNTTLSFNGGTMDVQGIENAAGVVVNGGSIHFTDAPDGFTPKSADGTPLYLNTATIQDHSGTRQTLRTVSGLFSGSGAATPVESYVCDKMMTDREGKLYLWLPAGETLQSCMTEGSGGALFDTWQYTDGDSATQDDSFTTKAEASEIIFEPYLVPGTSFPVTVEVSGYPNAQGFVYAQGVTLNKNTVSLSVGTKGDTFSLMIDSDSNTAGVNPLPNGYSVAGLYLNETPPASGSHSISDVFTTGGSNNWTEGDVAYGGPAYQFTMPEAAVSIVAVIEFTGTPEATNPTVTVNGVTMKAGQFLPSGAASDDALTKAAPAGGYAWLYNDNGALTLELNNASFISGGLQLSSNAENPALTIRLTGSSSLAGAGGSGSAGIFDAYEGNSYGGTDMTFTGSGSLTAAGSDVSASGAISAGISGGGDITIESGVTITATGGSAPADSSYGIRAAGDVSSSGNLVATGNDYGIMVAVAGSINITGGSITASGGTKALQPGALSGSATCSVSPIKAGASADTATVVASGADLTQYKYVQAPADAAAPSLTGGDASRTSDTAAAVKFTSSEAGAYYYAVVESGAAAPSIDTSGTGTACGTTEQTISLTGLTAGAKDIYIVVKDAAGNVSQPLKIAVPAYVVPTIQIFVRDMAAQDQVLTLNVSPTATIAEIKGMIASSKNIPAEKQRLVYQGKTLEDNKTLQDCSIQGGTTLYLMIIPTITTSSLPDGTTGTAYNQTLAADRDVTWSIESGSLPAGLSLDADTGVISGTPTTAGTYTFTVKATNSAGSDTKELSITLGRTLSKIEVTTQPKLVYSEDEPLDLSAMVVTAAYSDSSTTTLSYNSDGVAVSIANGTMLTKAAHNGQAITVTFEGKTAQTDALDVKSTNTVITQVKVNGINGAINDSEVAVVLPVGSTLPTADSAFSAVTQDAGASCAFTTDDASTGVWTLTVTAEDGQTTAAYTITVSVATNAVEQDLADVAAARSVLENHDWTVAQSTANTSAKVKTWIEGELAKLELNGAAFSNVTVTAITPAVAGTSGDMDGTDGSFSFNVTLTKGAATSTATVMTGRIIASPYLSKTNTKTEVQEFSDDDVTDELEKTDYNTPAKIETRLKTLITQSGVPSGNAVLYDVALLYSTDGGATWLRADKEHFPANGRLPISIPVPNDVDPSRHDFYGVHMFSMTAFGKTAGATEIVSFTERTEAGTTYLDGYVTGLSPILVGWKQTGTGSGDGSGSGGSGGGGSSSGSNHDDDNYNFWRQVKEKIEDAKSGDTVKANARYYDRMPVSVMEALRDNPGVAIVIDWYGGDTITIPAGKALDPESGRIYYPLSYLEGIDFGKAAAFENTNPNTGGDTFEVAAPAVTNAITTPAAEPEITDPRRGLAETPELAEKGIEQAIPGVYEPELTAPALDAAEPDAAPAKAGNHGLLFAGISVLLAALAVGGGWFLWRKRGGQEQA